MQNYLFPLWVALGGALGSLCRYGTTIYMARMAGTYFPFGTLAVNGAGSFLIGLLSVLLVKAYPNPAAAAFLITGFLGGLTTFSTFSAEVVERLLAGQPTLAIGLATVHLAGSLLATYLGLLTVGATRIWS